MKLIPDPSRETCWQHQTLCAPSKMFLISEASPVPCPLSGEQFGLGVPWGRFRTWTYSRQSPLKMAPRVPCSLCFPAGTTMALFKCHPIEPCGCQIGTGCLMFQAQEKVIKQSLGQWIPSNWQVHTWWGGSHSPDGTGAVCQSGKVLDRLNIQSSSTSAVRSGSSDSGPVLFTIISIISFIYSFIYLFYSKPQRNTLRQNTHLLMVLRLIRHTQLTTRSNTRRTHGFINSKTNEQKLKTATVKINWVTN